MTEKVEKAEEIPIMKARTQPEIPLEVLLQDPDNQLLDIPVNDDDEDLSDVQIDSRETNQEMNWCWTKEKKHFSKKELKSD